MRCRTQPMCAAASQMRCRKLRRRQQRRRIHCRNQYKHKLRRRIHCHGPHFVNNSMSDPLPPHGAKGMWYLIIIVAYKVNNSMPDPRVAASSIIVAKGSWFLIIVAKGRC